MLWRFICTLDTVRWQQAAKQTREAAALRDWRKARPSQAVSPHEPLARITRIRRCVRAITMSCGVCLERRNRLQCAASESRNRKSSAEQCAAVEAVSGQYNGRSPRQYHDRISVRERDPEQQIEQIASAMRA